MNSVRNMALKFMIEDALHSDDPALESLFGRIWDAGMMASEMCVLVSQKLGFTDTGISSTDRITKDDTLTGTSGDSTGTIILTEGTQTLGTATIVGGNHSIQFSEMNE